jgi:hypothetical protein
MAIRIMKTSDVGETVLRVDGHLRCDDVEELTGEYRSVDGPAVLELSNLQSADAAGVDTLLQLVSLGARIRGASPYVQLLLNQKP